MKGYNLKEIFKEIEDNESKNKEKNQLKKSAANIINQGLENPLKTLEKLEKAEKQLKKGGQNLLA